MFEDETEKKSGIIGELSMLSGRYLAKHDPSYRFVIDAFY